MKKHPRKLDQDKIRLDLIPPELIFGAGRGLTHGAKKYAPGNWAEGAGFDWSRLYGALQRHLNAFWSGEELDPDSGNHHLDHAACMLSFLMAHQARGIGNDNRQAIGVLSNEKRKSRPRSGKPKVKRVKRTPSTRKPLTSRRGKKPKVPKVRVAT